MAPQSNFGEAKIGPQATAVLTGSFLAGKQAFIHPFKRFSNELTSRSNPGAMISLSAMVVPVLLDTNTEPTLLLRQWVRLYHYGHIYMPAVCIATCGLYGYSTLSKRSSNRKQSLRYIMAGVVTIAMVPFTWAMMAPTNSILFELEASSSVPSTSVANLSIVQELLVKWAWLHLFRSFFPLLGAIVGLTGILKELRL